MAIDVRDIDDGDRSWLRDLLVESWGLPVVTPTGNYDEPHRLPGLLAERDGERIGAVIWDDVEGGRQVVSLTALERRTGVGRALMAGVRQRALLDGVDRVWLITTDDNETAIAFYTALGMQRVRVHERFIDVTRAAKPGLPADVFTDAIEFAWDLTGGGA